jgi:hypothetical protein
VRSSRTAEWPRFEGAIQRCHKPHDSRVTITRKQAPQGPAVAPRPVYAAHLTNSLVPTAVSIHRRAFPATVRVANIQNIPVATEIATAIRAKILSETGLTAEQGHFGRAAESCAVTQSTLSEGIKQLEARLDITLFERSPRNVSLTPLGKKIAARAQRLLAYAEEGWPVMRSHCADRCGSGSFRRSGRMCFPRCCRSGAPRCRNSSCMCGRLRPQYYWTGSPREISIFCSRLFPTNLAMWRR